MYPRALLFSLLLIAAGPAAAQDGAHIQVTGSAEVEVIPDYINIHVTIEKKADSKTVAKNSADKTTQAVLGTLDSLQIEEKHVDASQLFIAPEYRWDNNTRIHTGERATRTVAIRLYDLDLYTDLAARLVEIDITRMEQRGFGFDDMHSHMDSALVKALDKARIRAELMAGSLGRKLGAVYQVSESGYQPRPVARESVRMMAAAVSADEAGAPLEIRAQKIQASVSVVYLLE